MLSHLTCTCVCICLFCNAQIMHQCSYRTYLDEQNIEVVPTYLIAGKEVVKERAPANYTKKKVPEVTESFHRYMVKVGQLYMYMYIAYMQGSH